MFNRMPDNSKMGMMKLAIGEIDYCLQAVVVMSCPGISAMVWAPRALASDLLHLGLFFVGGLLWFALPSIAS